MKVTVNGKNLKGTIPAIASKSMAHRYLICASLADGITGVRCETRSDDISITAQCLRAMGAQLSYSDGGYFVGRGSAVKRPVLQCGESGSTFRFLLPVAAALGNGASFMRGSRLRVRPVGELLSEIARHGCSVSDGITDPLRIGGKLLPGYYEIPGDISSQFISGLLFALPLCGGESTISVTGQAVSAPYIDMTLSALADFGVEVEKEGSRYTVWGGGYVSPETVTVEGDWSSAAFWICAACLGADVSVTGLREDSLQGDRRITEEAEKLKSGEKKVFIDAADIPDLVPALSVAAACREGTTVIYNADRLRHKESDRLRTVSEMLKALGGSCTETADGLKITGGKLCPGKVFASGDHRIAMAAAIASVAAGDVEIEGAEAVSKSYPAFWEDFRKLGGSVSFE